MTRQQLLVRTALGKDLSQLLIDYKSDEWARFCAAVTATLFTGGKSLIGWYLGQAAPGAAVPMPVDPPPWGSRAGGRATAGV